ncbi:MAG TPA: hypothetical protein VEX13_10985 [Chloroflexia bacterium]|nr:hypothetical protein [Chloroflexia bacterium]
MMRRRWRVWLVLVAISVQSLVLQSTVHSQEAAWPEEWQADSAFSGVWSRADGPVAMRAVARSWLWGPVPFAVANEQYAESLTGRRLVEYLDKGRMEINDPELDRDSQWFVTSGLLVYEMVSGQVQVGNTLFEQSEPAAVPVAGDAASPGAPTYATFGQHLTPATQLDGGLAQQHMSGDGTVTPLATIISPEQAKLYTYKHYDDISKHNVPAVFYDWARQSGTVFEDGRLVQAPLFDPLYVLGRPITEAYWIDVLVAGAPATVLVQLYERRALTYNPSNPPEWRIEMANVGRAYYDWRYKDKPVEPAIATTITPNGLTIKGWNWPQGSVVSVQADLAGNPRTLSGPQEATSDQSGRFSATLSMSEQLQSALLAEANVSARATSQEASTALPVAGKAAVGKMQLEGTIIETGTGQPTQELRLMERNGKEWTLLVHPVTEVLYSEGSAAPADVIRPGMSASVEGTMSGGKVAVTMLKLLSVSRTGAQIGYTWQDGGLGIRVSGTGWPAELPVALTLTRLNTGGPPTLTTIRADSRGNLAAVVQLPADSALPAGPLWLFATSADKDTLLAQVAVPFEPQDSRSAPPQLFALSAAGEQSGGLGSYCWQGVCADRIGIPLPQGVMQVTPGEVLGLRSQYGPDLNAGLTPTSFSAQLYPYPDNSASEGVVQDGVFYFSPKTQPIHATGEVPGRPFSVPLPGALPRGKYALLVSVIWPDLSGGRGDAVYGFTLQVP